MKNPTIQISLFCATVLLVGLSRTRAADQIDLRDGKPILGKILRETATEVEIQGTAGKQTVAVNRIVKIHYEGQPATLTHARSTEESYDLSGAADEYAKVQGELKDKPLILLAAQFGEARARARLALDESTGVDAAIARLEKLDRENPDSRHHFVALELLARLYHDKKDYAKAAQTFDQLATAPWPEAKFQSDVYHARMLRSQNKLDEAIVRLDVVLAAKTESCEQGAIQTEALLEKAGCLRAQNKREAEIETLEKVLDRAPTQASSLQAEAYAALGDAYRDAGKTKDALLAYLHVELLFAKNKELHARALYNLSKLWKELDQPDRAAAAQSTLKSEYPNSPWTKKLGS